MRILLIGEYSNMHATLAESFRRFGHEVLVVSDGDGWKNYPRDIDVSRKEGFWGGMTLRWRLMRKILPKLIGFDVVHLINPQWLDVDPSLTETLNDYLKVNNKIFSLGLYGDDFYILKGQSEGVLEYSDTFCDGSPINVEANEERKKKWLVSCQSLCEKTTASADCLIANLYEYYKIYENEGFGKKLHYISSPIKEYYDIAPKTFVGQISILIGKQSDRSEIKGTDILARYLIRLAGEYPDRIALKYVQDMPFDKYKELLAKSDIVVDQLYSYTPAMNALEAMKNGTVVVSGGEEEYYSFIGEQELRPIINLRPNRDEENYSILKEILISPERLSVLSKESIGFVKKYHEADMIAKQYIDAWLKVRC